MMVALLGGTAVAQNHKAQIQVDEQGVSAVVNGDTVVKMKTTPGVAVEDSGYNYNYAEDADGNEVADPDIEPINRGSKDDDFSFISDITEEKSFVFMIVCVTGIVFGFPLILILGILYYRYRSRQNKYKLAAKALENGQPIPDGLFGGYTQSARFQRQQAHEQTAKESQAKSEVHEAQPESSAEAPQTEPFAESYEQPKTLADKIRSLYAGNTMMTQGIRQFFLGVGLIAFCEFAGWSSFFMGLGWLVLWIGVGRMVVGWIEGGPRKH